jgi:hypothetical protein
MEGCCPMVEEEETEKERSDVAKKGKNSLSVPSSKTDEYV